MKLTIPAVLNQFIAYYQKPNNGTWGSLHIVLDDGNVHDDHVKFCLNHTIENGDTDGQELAKILLQMTKTQRLKIPSKVYEQIKKMEAGAAAVA